MMETKDISDLLRCGCYVLLYRREVVYVGHTENPLQRIGKHSGDKMFDRIWFVPCKKGDLLDLEDHLILCLRPRYNRTVRQGAASKPPMTEAAAKRIIEGLNTEDIPRAPSAGFDLVKAAGLKPIVECRRI